MTKITRSGFTDRLTNKGLRVAELEATPLTAPLRAAQADTNRDGLISGKAELENLFRQLDAFDADGSIASMRLADDEGRPTRAGKMVAAVNELARQGLLPDTLSKDAFVGLLKDRMIPLEGAAGPSAAALRSADLNRDGVVAGQSEAQRLFAHLDRADRNGDANSVRRASGETLTPVGAQIDALLQAREVDTTDAWAARPEGRLGQAYADFQSKLASGVSLRANKVRLKNRVLRTVRKRWPLIQEVARRADLPPEMVASIWYREDSGMRVNRYLHNGQRLGRTTTLVPKGIFFREDQFVDAAVHALTQKRPTKEALNLSHDSNDLAAMAAFTERYNGFGYRNNGHPSPYVTAGTDLYSRGLYVADGRFRASAVDGRLGTLPLMQAIRREIRAGEVAQPEPN